MTVRVAINGFGRIGRLVLRSIVEHGRRDIEVVAINDLGPVSTNAHLLKYDSVHGRFPGTVEHGDDWIDVGLGKIKVTAERDPAKLPHKDLNVDIAFECTGIFTSKEKASAHLTAGAKRVLVSAPCDNADKTIVYKVNHDTLTAEDIIVSNGSCTTNALAPVAKVLNDLFGIERGYMTTIHAYTGDQPTLDTMHKDLYRGRAAALSMIPTSTGAAKALGLVLPELKGKLDGSSIRVPTPNVSVVDLKVVAGREVTVEEIKVSDPLKLKMPPPVVPAVFPVTVVSLSVRFPTWISNPPPVSVDSLPLTSDLFTVTVPSTVPAFGTPCAAISTRARGGR